MSDYCKNRDFAQLIKDKNYLITPQNEYIYKKIYYEYETNPYSYQNHRDQHLSQEELSKILPEWFYSIYPFVFRKVFNCYCRCSRSSGIGSKFLDSHIEDFKNGKFTLPSFSGKTLLVPYYFIRKTKEQLYRYVQNDSKILGISHSSNLFVNKNKFDDFFAVTDPFSHDLCSNQKVVHISYANTNQIINELIHSDFSFVDHRLHTHCLALFDNSGNITINHYIYNRSTRNYILFKQESFDVFCRSVFESFNLYNHFYERTLALSYHNIYLLDSFLSDLDDFCNTFLDISYKSALIDIADHRRDIYRQKLSAFKQIKSLTNKNKLL